MIKMQTNKQTKTEEKLMNRYVISIRYYYDKYELCVYFTIMDDNEVNKKRDKNHKTTYYT